MENKLALALIFEKFNLLSDSDFKSWMLNNHDYLFALERHNIELAFVASKMTLKDEEQYYQETFKSEIEC
jgi:hypothetical protein